MDSYRRVVVVILVLILLCAVVPFIKENHPSAPPQLTIGDLVKMGTPLTEQEALVQKIRDDLSIEQEVKILIGNYFFIFGHASMVSEESYCYVFIDGEFYRIITAEERIAMIAHEVGHIKGLPPNYMELDLVQKIKEETDADTYAAQLTSPDTVIGLLEKAKKDAITYWLMPNGVEYNLRMSNLKKLRDKSLPK